MLREESIHQTITQQTKERIEERVLEHAQHLGNSATKVVGAMEAHDDSMLHEVINETLKLRKEIESLRSTVYEDALTQVFNRKWFQDNLTDEDVCRQRDH